MISIINSIDSRLIKYLIGLSPEYDEIIRTIPQDKIMSRMSPIDKLEYMATFYNHLPKQGSDEWLNARRVSIGGSEVATVLGNNPYQDINDFYRQKLGMKKFNGNLFTRWGTHFEDITVLYIEQRYNTKVFNFGSIEGLTYNGRVVQAYSPDGLCVIDNNIVLLEIKSPYSRIPTGSIPSHYIDQIQTGLYTINDASYGLFCDAVYRKCNVETLNFTNEYDAEYHKSNKEFGTPICVGYSIFWEYGSTEDVKHQIRTLHESNPKYYSDLLFLPKDAYSIYTIQTLSKLHNIELPSKWCYVASNNMVNIRSKKINRMYLSNDNIIDNLVADIHTCIKRGKVILDFVPWKMFHISETKVERQDDYMAGIRERLIDVHKTLCYLAND